MFVAGTEILCFYAEYFLVMLWSIIFLYYKYNNSNIIINIFSDSITCQVTQVYITDVVRIYITNRGLISLHECIIIVEARSGAEAKVHTFQVVSLTPTRGN